MGDRWGGVRSSSAPGGAAGLSLMEVLVAASVAAITLTAVWPFAWSVAFAALDVDRRTQTGSAGAFAARALQNDLEVAVRLLAPPESRSPERCLLLEQRHIDGGVENVLIVWDPARRLLWRKTSSTYLCERVCAFHVRYFRRDGTPLSHQDLLVPGWNNGVARVQVEASLGTPEEPMALLADVPLRSR